MPVAAPRVCGHCGGVHSKGERCPKVAKRDAERKATFDKKRPSARQRGYDAAWERLRTDHLTVYPSCRRCGATAVLVDHIIKVKDAPHRRLDPANLQSLCQPCHSGWKQSLERKAK